MLNQKEKEAIYNAICVIAYEVEQFLGANFDKETSSLNLALFPPPKPSTPPKTHKRKHTSVVGSASDGGIVTGEIPSHPKKKSRKRK